MQNLNYPPNPCTSPSLSAAPLPVVVSQDELIYKFGKSQRRFYKEKNTDLLPNHKVLARKLLEELPKNPLENSKTKTVEALSQKIQEAQPDLHPELSIAFAKDILQLNKERRIVEHLVEINEEIFDQINTKRGKLLGLQGSWGLPTEKTKQWMENIIRYEQETTNPTILKFLYKTEQRIKENLTQTTSLILRGVNLHPRSPKDKPFITISPNPNIQNIPRTQLEAVRKVQQSLEESRAYSKSPLLILAKFLRLGAPQSWIQPQPHSQNLKEKAHQNIKSGVKTIIEATNSLDPLKPKKRQETPKRRQDYTPELA
jgi:hypothetical protein